MKRNIILFLLAFLLTLAVGAGIWFLFFPTIPLPGIPHSGQSTAPTVAQESSNGSQPHAANEPGAAAQEKTPAHSEASTPSAAKPGNAASGPSEQASAADTSTEGSSPAHGAATALVPAEKPRSVEHKAALLLEAALKSEDSAAALQQLAERGTVSKEAADALKLWAQGNKSEGVEEVGSFRREDGAKVTRFRLKSREGKEDMLVDVVTNPDGTVQVVAAHPTASDKTQVVAASDSLTVAEGFVEAVRRGDMLAARRLVTGSDVSDATVAGLCMVFEEGAFALRPDAPIRNTFQNDEHAGYLVYVIAAHNPKPCNIGLELLRTEPGWRVNAVALDTLLSSYEERANAEGGHYFPIVKNPKGGDSLALFFAFNQSDLTPRSLRQLQIVAELLKLSQGKLNISGHTDDVGSEQYNQALSERRADAVKAALVSFGVKEEQITAHGLGKSQPRRVYTAQDSEQQIDYIRGENRRAEIYLDFEP